MLNRALILLSLLVLAACAPRGQITYDPAAVGVGAVERIFIGTTRLDDGENAFSRGRSFAARFGRFDISIPPDRELGTLPWPPRNGPADPRKHMVTVDGTMFDGAAEFRKALSQEMARSRRGEREAVVFVHGFNNTFAEGVYRFAQMYHDMELSGVPVHYSWPSRGSVMGYAYDRDSALFARDGLEQLLHQIAEAGADRILIMAHSMGSHLAMETLRQIAVRRDRPVLDRLGGVVLISPDIDVDVFRSQAQTFGKLPQPFVIFSSRRDRALALSATIAGERNRLGNVQDVSILAGLDVTLLEVGALSSGTGHLTAGTSPALLRMIANARDIDDVLGRDAQSRVGLLPAAVLTVQGATQVILSPVAQIGEEVNAPRRRPQAAAE